MPKRIIIAGGGTGGHIFPAVAVANALRKIDPGVDILFIGAKGKMEMEKVPQAGYEIVGLNIAGFNRSNLLKNLALPFKLMSSFFRVWQLLRQFKPQAVFGVGGYSSYPVLRMAQVMGIATFLHESNAFAGKSNILLGKKATAVFVAHTGMDKFFPAAKIRVTGNPVRAQIAKDDLNKQDALAYFNLQQARPVLFVMGGSLGAKSINEAIAGSLQHLVNQGLQIIWQTGKPFSQMAAQVAAGLPQVWVADFIKEMQYAYAAADIVVSRAGAMSVAELCIAGKPVIFVPYPFAAEDHQTANAMALVQNQAAMLVKDEEVKVKLAGAIVELTNNEELRKQMMINIKAMAVTHADEEIANQIWKHIE